MKDPELVGSLLATIRSPDGDYDAAILAERLGVTEEWLLPLCIELPERDNLPRIRVLPYARALMPRFAQFGLRLLRAPGNGTVWRTNVTVAVVAEPLLWNRHRAIARMNMLILGSPQREVNDWKDVTLVLTGPLLDEAEAEAASCSGGMVIGFPPFDDAPFVAIAPKIQEVFPDGAGAYEETIYDTDGADVLRQSIWAVTPGQDPTSEDIDRAARAGNLSRSLATNMTLRGRSGNGS